ncbi:MAG: FHA domain-containing protein [Pelotomaculum sp.]|uniref:Hypothetical signaling protein n=1 Tax=Pelotomaculum thermopropionicum (strain DSM 13744 / JCM 10971 / SI) TaxID=370438 RepID=A5D1B4_PELTS|nr:FHA domain-containing protein [Pelotomaculum sp.]BAF59966.1 hypothetical signaling protein [Pelotomaculum thermopropionicum SI]
MILAALTLLRYIFLLLLFIFIFKLVKWMVGDLRGTAGMQAGLLPVRTSGGGKTGGGRITVVESSLLELLPGESFAIGREIIIGRGAGSDIRIRDSYTSTRHARIYFKEGQYWLEDLKSTNGTFLNGLQVGQPTVLADGDRLRIGGVTFQFVRWGYEVGSGN